MRASDSSGFEKLRASSDSEGRRLTSAYTHADHLTFFPSAGSASGYAVHGAKSNFWYNSLKAPAYGAPKEAYGIVWPILYAVSGFGSYLIAQNIDASNVNTVGAFNPASRETAIECLNLYWISLAANVAWTPLFFGLQKPILALADIVALTGVVGAICSKANTLPKVHGVSPAVCFLPYFAWVAYAAYENAAIVYQNYSINGTRRTPKSL